MDLLVNKKEKSFIQNKYNDLFADQVFTQLQNRKDPIPPMLKYHPSYRILNPDMRDGLLIGIIM